MQNVKVNLSDFSAYYIVESEGFSPVFRETGQTTF